MSQRTLTTEFGSALRTLRETFGLSLSDTAKRAGVRKRWLKRIEEGAPTSPGVARYIAGVIARAASENRTTNNAVSSGKESA